MTYEDADGEIQDLKARLVQHTYTPESLAKLLDLKLESTEDIADIAAAHRLGVSESLEFQSRSRWVAQDPEFQDWVSSSRSKVLSIQGHAEMDKLSPLSFLVSLLHEQLEQGSLR